MTCPYQIQNIGKCKLQNRSCNHYENSCYIREAETTKQETMAEVRSLFNQTLPISSFELVQSQNNGLKIQNTELQAEVRTKNTEIENIHNTIKLSLINFRRGLEGIDITASPEGEKLDYINWALSNLSNIIEEKDVQES